MTSQAEPEFWSGEADRFDDEPDHGLHDPETAAAWRELLVTLLPPAPARVADVGCGAGSLAVLLGQLGYRVDAVDFSPAMVVRAEAKAAASNAETRPRFVVGDAAAPPLPDRQYDVVLVRHVTWALPDPAQALSRWRNLLTTSGRLALVEGFWSTGAGLRADELAALVRQHFDEVQFRPLADHRLWGRPITDERYLLTARRPDRSKAKPDD